MAAVQLSDGHGPTLERAAESDNRRIDNHVLKTDEDLLDDSPFSLAVGLLEFLERLVDLFVARLVAEFLGQLLDHALSLALLFSSHGCPLTLLAD